ncbi:Glutathione S-transferase zeta-1 [Coemansia javaensis]|uniref:Glutathione S-transferase zeta-1 n=1 Tax=Coemansia javaensis TaxID=2761396 RepID=A0A9W8HJ38_9FUNG|nr:Glutathione S-transferase zeta-1 [Coemansia javaensis]
MDSAPVLYTYYRSSCSARVRIALNHKGIDYEARPINLVSGEQLSAEYTAQNPSGLVPLLVIDGREISQSVAILEYLEETRPAKPLLPADPAQRAQVRTLVGVICCDIQPLQNLRVLKTVPEDQRPAYARAVIESGLAVFEKMLERTAGRFCVGDEVTLADCCLIPQLYNARRFGVDIARFPRIQQIEARANALPAFRAAHWTRQPDCPAELASQHALP